jgi:hypothetical protein
VNPNLVEALESLRAKNVLSQAQAGPLLREARGERVSARPELKTLLYAGVLLTVSAAGLFLKENRERLGPALIASLVGAAAAACLVYAFRRSPAFTWGRAASPHVGADYLLLLGVLLGAADLAYLETQFALLGPNWPYHLLVVSLLSLAAAYRFDSRAVLSFALASFAAWRGVAVSLPYASGWSGGTTAVRANALACGAVFVAVGILTGRSRRKPHFEPVWTTMGLLLLFGGVLSGALQRGTNWVAWEAILALLGAAVLALALRLRRPLDFAIAVAALYVGVLRLTSEVLDGTTLSLFIAVWSLAALAVLLVGTRRLRQAR